ncbi:EamA family transporter RarD [Sphingomonas arantia]|uniref:EamA family transporter RarD n=1 Tax=Sphingomonas arantia TaxID=1460676 RepID=A0ABW4TST7_9SPHN
MGERTARIGALCGLGAYVSWGLLPLFLKLLVGVPPVQILAHRVLWSLLLLVVIVTIARGWGAVRTACRSRRTLLLLCASAVLIAINWLVYIWAVVHGHVIEASLGYFINPLVNVAIGVAVLGERLRPVQLAAVAIAAVGVAVLALSGTGALWISITLALSFGTYGLVRKVVAVDALAGLTLETALLAPIAALVLVLSATGSDALFGAPAFGQSARLDMLLMTAGVVTALPLLMFAAAARRMKYATLGLFQYIAPSLQFAEAVWLFGEPLRTVHLVTFGCIWAGCALYAADTLRASRAVPAMAAE